MHERVARRQARLREGPAVPVLIQRFPLAIGCRWIACIGVPRMLLAGTRRYPDEGTPPSSWDALVGRTSDYGAPFAFTPHNFQELGRLEAQGRARCMTVSGRVPAEGQDERR